MATTQLYTVIPGSTQATQIMPAVQYWTQVTLSKETSGVVIFGTQSFLIPVGSARGVQIPSTTPVTFYLGPDTELWIAAEDAYQRVAVITNPVPQIDQMLAGLANIQALLAELRPPEQQTVVVVNKDPSQSGRIGLGDDGDGLGDDGDGLGDFDAYDAESDDDLGSV